MDKSEQKTMQGEHRSSRHFVQEWQLILKCHNSQTSHECDSILKELKPSQACFLTIHWWTLMKTFILASGSWLVLFFFFDHDECLSSFPKKKNFIVQWISSSVTGRYSFWQAPNSFHGREMHPDIKGQSKETLVQTSSSSCVSIFLCRVSLHQSVRLCCW